MAYDGSGFGNADEGASTGTIGSDPHVDADHDPISHYLTAGLSLPFGARALGLGNLEEAHHFFTGCSGDAGNEPLIWLGGIDYLQFDDGTAAICSGPGNTTQDGDHGCGGFVPAQDCGDSRSGLRSDAVVRARSAVSAFVRKLGSRRSKGKGGLKQVTAVIASLRESAGARVTKDLGRLLLLVSVFLFDYVGAPARAAGNDADGFDSHSGDVGADGAVVLDIEAAPQTTFGDMSTKPSSSEQLDLANADGAAADANADLMEAIASGIANLTDLGLIADRSGGADVELASMHDGAESLPAINGTHVAGLVAGNSIFGGNGNDFFTYTNIDKAGDAITDLGTIGGTSLILDQLPMFFPTFISTGGITPMAQSVASGHLAYNHVGADAQVLADAEASSNNLLQAALSNTNAGLAQSLTLI